MAEQLLPAAEPEAVRNYLFLTSEKASSFLHEIVSSCCLLGQHFFCPYFSALKNRFSFPKSERLCSRKAIEALFGTGEKQFIFPFRLAVRNIEQPMPDDPDAAPFQILISVPKKVFKRAVDRNLIKRRIREAYRLHKHVLYSRISDRSSELPAFQLHIGFLYVAKTIEPWEIIEKKMIQVLTEIGDQIPQKTTQ